MAMKLDNREAELHNAQINERYQRLLNAEAEQFAENTETRPQSTYQTRASVLTPEKPVGDTPVYEQTPQITEYTREVISSPVFTTEKYNATVQPIREETPVMTAIPVQAPVMQTSVAVEPQYSLTSFAKLVMAAVAAVVVLMFTIIGINSGIIARNEAQFNALQARRAELVEENEELTRRIENATSEDTIRSWANEKGMISAQG